MFIATYFLRNLKDIYDWDDVSEYAPSSIGGNYYASTFSIAHGIAPGFIAHVVIKAVSGKTDDPNMDPIAIAGVSVLYFAVVQ